MVTVITTKEELSTPAHNGVADTGFSDNERLFQYIKDFQEVDLYRTASFKPLPKDLIGTVDGEVPKSSIKGTFLVQIDAIEPCSQTNNNQNEPNGPSSLLLTITDGLITVQAVTNDAIPNLHLNTRIGAKLLLTENIPIKDGLLQLTHDNTRFQYGSNTYPRPRQGYRGRPNGPPRGPYEGRRNNRYENEDGETSFFKRPPPKTTLMDFMTSLKISDDSDSDKGKERNGNTKRRPNQESYPSQATKSNTSSHAAYQTHYPLNNNHYATGVYNDQIVYEQEDFEEPLEGEDESGHAIYRERRNPLPPRLQRAQEERSRRNPTRYYDDATAYAGNEPNSIYRNDAINQLSYMPNNSAMGHQNAASLTSFIQHPSMLATMNGTTPTHLAYYSTNPNHLSYSIAGVHSPPYANQQLPLGPGYNNDRVAYCYGAPYTMSTYLPASSMSTDVSGETKNNGNSGPVNSSADESEKSTRTELPNEENTDSGNNEDFSSAEQKATLLSSNDGSSHPQQINIEQQEEKRRDPHSNPRPRWKVGDMCLARWHEDGEFYLAAVLEIRPPFCAVIFCEYNTYEQVHFSEMKVIPRDQHYYPYVPPSIVPSTEYNPYAPNTYFPARADYYSTMGDGCMMMPEAPPFPFNSAGTLYMSPAPLASLVARPPRSNTNGFAASQGRRTEPVGNATINSSSPPSKDSDETNNTSTDDPSQEQQVEEGEAEDEEDLSSPLGKPQPCSIADAPLKLVRSDGPLKPSGTGKDVEPKVDKNDDDNKEGRSQQEN